jgi:hypothetical protein
MQITNSRYIILIAALLAGAGLYAVFGEAGNSGQPRWPAADSVFTVPSWSVEPQSVEDTGHQTALVTRVFHNAAGAVATMTIVTQPVPKLYGAGAEVPFLGSGYTVVPTPDDMAALEGGGVNALVAQRGTEQWLAMYAYGERRGLLGNGPLPWTLAVLDGIVGRSNDYYKFYLVARIDQSDPGARKDVAELARTLFPRLSAWYAA